MSDGLVILFLLYVQCGVYAAWYFFNRRVTIVREDFAAERAAREASQIAVESKLEILGRIVEELKGIKAQTPQQRESPAFRQARRRGALEMSRSGLDSHHIAETLNMRPYEVETLIRMERLRQGSGAALEETTRYWLDAAN